jgi:transcriptional regulator with XRE-family HTH domain
VIPLSLREDTLANAGEQLKKLRARTKQSLFKIAKAVHISGNYLSEIERGLKEPSDVVLESISDCYNVERTNLFALYGKIAPIEKNVLLDNPTFRKTIVQISTDKRLTEDERTQLYKEFSNLYASLINKKDNEHGG